jgi:hypothetical protein
MYNKISNIFVPNIVIMYSKTLALNVFKGISAFADFQIFGR